MTKFSPPPLAAEKVAYFLDNLWLSFTLPQNAEEFRSFLSELLTPTEAKILAKRLQIARLLVEGKTYQEIKNATHAQNSTIAQVNNILNNVEESSLKKVAMKLDKLARVPRQKTWPRSEKHPQKKFLKFSFGTFHNFP